ncbi:trans-aconitate 2-methyltransferase [Pseudonocardia sp. N23]|uniref:trans-aconitate 2-methyltransferase n=1 Tax=Pseudonocardia sp. N23 TaxID=1987376 RepID=UPI000BFB4B09|nr:trans-aconitate 2-methyltransferase [Pseudonocardia sp. N23]GAY10397.1 trans-aconitate 2-methyltransferase [Pseudonocardia sp. N23]
MSRTTWDPALYLTFDDARSRPFFDLVARIGADAPRRVVDLGCGPGHLTEVLARRWPDAAVEAVDSSPEMVAAARERGIDAVLTDVGSWTPRPDTDVVVTNAVLQWVPTHPELLARWVEMLPPGAWFAMQVPGNFGAPSHALSRDLADRRGLTLRDELAVREPADYASILGGPDVDVDVWETTYLQRLTGDDPVLTWITATALRPVRDALDDDAYADFRAELAPLLREAYPVRPDGTTWLPFRRIFAVAHKRS